MLIVYNSERGLQSVPYLQFLGTAGSLHSLPPGVGSTGGGSTAEGMEIGKDAVGKQFGGSSKR